MRYICLFLCAVSLAWSQLPPAPEPKIPGSTPQWLDDKMRQIEVNVKDFGAKGDGITDDTAAIQLAIENTPPRVGLLHIPHGTYSISTITIDSSITVVIDNSTITSQAQNHVFHVTASYVTIKGSGSAYTHVHACAPGAVAIDIEVGASHVNVSDMWIEGPGNVINLREQENAVNAWGARGSTCPTRSTNISVFNNTFSAVHSGVYYRCITDSRIENNHWITPSAGFSMANLHSTNNTVVAGNTAVTTGGSSNGVEIVDLGDVPSMYNTVSGNTFNGNFTFEVINVVGGSGNVISGNTMHITGPIVNLSIFGRSPAGIRVTEPGGGDTVSSTHHNVVTGNIIDAEEATGATGISINTNDLSGVHLASHDNMITNNIVRAPLFPIGVSDYCTRNQFIGNYVDMSGFTNPIGDGITAQGANISGTLFANNTVRGAARNGIYVNSGHDITLTGNVVFGTRALDPTGGHGIQVIGNHISVTGNTTYNNVGWGIEAYGASNLNLASNSSYNNSAGTISFQQSNLVLIPSLFTQFLSSDKVAIGGNYANDALEIYPNISGQQQILLGNNNGIRWRDSAGAAKDAGIFFANDNWLYLRNPVIGASKGIAFLAEDAFPPVAYMRDSEIALNRQLLLANVTFSGLGTPTSNQSLYCTDCTVTAPCAGGGSGAYASSVNSVWNCNDGSPGSGGSPPAHTNAGGSAPTAAADTAAGVSSGGNCYITIGRDEAFQVACDIGTTPSGIKLVTVTYNSTFTNSSIASCTSANPGNPIGGIHIATAAFGDRMEIYNVDTQFTPSVTYGWNCVVKGW